MAMNMPGSEGPQPQRAPAGAPGLRRLTSRARPDRVVLPDHVRPERKSPARAVYLLLLLGLAFYLLVYFVEPYVVLQTGGIVTTERFTVALPYTSRVANLYVAPGDKVHAGMPLLSFEAPDVLDIKAKLSGQKNALLARDLQVAARLATIGRIKPVAAQRRERAEETSDHISRTKVREFIPLSTHTDVGRELYEAKREDATLDAEAESLNKEHAELGKALAEVETAMDEVRRTYGDGIIRSPVEGIVSTRVPSAGSVARAGDPMLDLLHGNSFVLAWVPIGRLYRVYPGMAVSISDGSQTRNGRIERIEPVADALPPEFQNAFRPTDRQQIVRIAYEQAAQGQPAFTALSKVEVSSLRSTSNLMALLNRLLSFEWLGRHGTAEIEGAGAPT